MVAAAPVRLGAVALLLFLFVLPRPQLWLLWLWWWLLFASPPLGCLWRFSISAQSVVCPPPSSSSAVAVCGLGLDRPCRALCLRSHARRAFCSLSRVLCSPLPSCLFLARLAMASSNVSPSRMYQCAGPSCPPPGVLPPCSACGGCWSWHCPSISRSSSSSSSAGGCGGGGLGCAVAVGCVLVVRPGCALGGRGGGCLTGGPVLAPAGGVCCWCWCWSVGCWAPGSPSTPLLPLGSPLRCACGVWLAAPVAGRGPFWRGWCGILGVVAPRSGGVGGCRGWWWWWATPSGWCSAACRCDWNASRAFRLCCRSSCSTMASHGALAGTMGIVTVRCSSCSPMVGTWVAGRKGGW